MRHGEDGETTHGDARLARFDATQDVILAASPFADRTRAGTPPTLAEHDANAERLAEACRRYLMTHAVVKATTP